MYQNMYQHGHDGTQNEDPAYSTAMYQTRLPQALERVLMNRERRSEHDIFKDQEETTDRKQEETTDTDIFASDEEIPKSEPKKSKIHKKKKKSKNRQNRAKMASISEPVTSEPLPDNVVIEYLEEEIKFDVNDPNYLDYTRIFEAFKTAEARSKSNRIVVRNDSNAVKDEAMNVVPIKARGAYAQLEVEKEAAENTDKPKLSKKQWKKLNRYTVAELKQLVERPELVEMQDVTANDPKLLIFLKSYRNTVRVPRHWCFKRKYLQGKRGFEKTPFVLPDYIRATGIMELRGVVQEKESHKSLKSKMRDKIRPKVGKIDIDYAKLHDAFFRWQTKPSRMTGHGDIYYESKEFETKLMEKKPGNLSEELRMALGMPLGPDAYKFPPPWLIAMQRYGPPPSYPNMRIPGLNAPIPDNCSFGYHAGGWGKPPVDASGKPLYGDVFAVYQVHVPEVEIETVDKKRWGQLEKESESEEVTSDDEVEMEPPLEKEFTHGGGVETPMEGFITPSGTSTFPIGLETPDTIELRKKKIEDYMDSTDTPALYHVLPEKKVSIGSDIMGSSHVYDVSAASKVGRPIPADQNRSVEVTLNPDDLDLDSSRLKTIYDDKIRQDDDSNMPSVGSTDHVSKRKHKEHHSSTNSKSKSSSSSKKHKDFKF